MYFTDTEICLKYIWNIHNWLEIHSITDLISVIMVYYCFENKFFWPISPCYTTLGFGCNPDLTKWPATKWRKTKLKHILVQSKETLISEAIQSVYTHRLVGNTCYWSVKKDGWWSERFTGRAHPADISSYPTFATRKRDLFFTEKWRKWPFLHLTGSTIHSPFHQPFLAPSLFFPSYPCLFLHGLNFPFWHVDNSLPFTGCTENTKIRASFSFVACGKRWILYLRDETLACQGSGGSFLWCKVVDEDASYCSPDKHQKYGDDNSSLSSLFSESCVLGMEESGAFHLSG